MDAGPVALLCDAGVNDVGDPGLLSMVPWRRSCGRRWLAAGSTEIRGNLQQNAGFSGVIGRFIFLTLFFRCYVGFIERIPSLISTV
jgi:hypothetical protein